MPIEQTPFGTDSFADNPQNRCPCVLLLDTSASMSGAPIQELQRGIEQYRDELMGDNLARQRVEVAIITFGNTVRTEQTFTTADSLILPNLQAGGSTPMAAALLEGVRLVEGRKKDYRDHGIAYYRPWIFLITDGEPTDADLWQSPLNELKTRVEAKALTLFVVGVKGANMNKLRELPALNGPQSLDQTRFRDLFIWLSQSQKGIAASRPGDQLSLPAPNWVIIS